MPTLFFILIVLACVVLGLIVLVQNPKGGGLSGTFGGMGNQFMGVKQTTDVLEKGTWIFAGVIGVLCLVSSLFISGGTVSAKSNAVDAAVPAANQAPASTTPGNNTFAIPDSLKK